MLTANDRSWSTALPARYRLRYVLPGNAVVGWTVLAVATTAYAVLRSPVVSGDVLFGAIVGLVLVIGFAVLSALRRPGVPITAKHQPELFALVHDVAARAGPPPPTSVWLTHTTVVEAQARVFRRELLIGRVLVPCLTESELRSLIAHELVILSLGRPRLVVRLSRLWTAAASIVGEPSALAQTRRIVTDIQPFGEAVHAVADTVTISAAGHRHAAAQALLMQDLIGLQYNDFVDETRTPPAGWWRSVRVIEDLDDAWQRWTAHMPPLTVTGSDGIEALELTIDRPHPTLAGSAAALLGQRFSFTPASPAIRLEPLSRRHQRRLARRLRKLLTNDAVRWYTFATAPAVWWSDRATQEADIIRGAIATVLGRAPVDTFEAVEVLITRNREVAAALRARARLEPEPEDPEGAESDYAPPPVLSALVEDLRRVWRLDHPATRGVLTGPNGERIDATRAVTRTESGYDLEPLRTVLRPDLRDIPLSPSA